MVVHKGKNKNFHRGFTLIEMLVAVTLFVLVLLVATDLFQKIIQGQRSTITAINIQENLRYAFEIISKEARNAQLEVGECISNMNQDDLNTYSALQGPQNKIPVGSTNKGIGRGKSLIFRNKYGQCVHYYMEDGRFMVARGDSLYPITPENINVVDLFFYVKGPTNSPDFNNERFSVTIFMQAEIGQLESEKHALDIQTTITSRNYEN